MKFHHSVSQSNPSEGYLDVVFCFSVFLMVVLIILLMSRQNMEKKTHHIKKESVVLEQKKFDTNTATVQPSRFKGGGGQPFIRVVFDYDKDFGLKVIMAKRIFTWFEFRKFLCNLDRKEANNQPSFLFFVVYTERTRNASDNDLFNEFEQKISLDTIKEYRQKYPEHFIINLYKLFYEDFERVCNDFKAKYTTEVLGNWEGKDVSDKQSTSYDIRKKLGDPFLWFSVNEKKQVVLGDLDNGLKLSPMEFVGIVSSVEGGDGFYIEYRSVDNLKKQSDKIPEWVIDEIIKPLGFSAVVD